MTPKVNVTQRLLLLAMSHCPHHQGFRIYPEDRLQDIKRKKRVGTFPQPLIGLLWEPAPDSGERECCLILSQCDPCRGGLFGKHLCGLLNL